MGKHLKITINWKFKLLVFGGFSLISFLFFSYLFESDLGYSLAMSLTSGIFYSLGIYLGLDVLYLKENYKNYTYQTTAYMQINRLFFIPGKLFIIDDNLIFITHKLNAKQNKLSINIENIEAVDKTNFLRLFKKGLKVKTKAGQQYRFWVSDQKGLINCFNKNMKDNRV